MVLVEERQCEKVLQWGFSTMPDCSGLFLDSFQTSKSWGHTKGTQGDLPWMAAQMDAESEDSSSDEEGDEDDDDDEGTNDDEGQAGDDAGDASDDGAGEGADGAGDDDKGDDNGGDDDEDDDSSSSDSSDEEEEEVKVEVKREVKKEPVKRKRATTDDGEPKPKRKKRNGPKAATNPYQFFCKEYRPKLKEANPDKSFGELARLCGAQWKLLSEDDKKPYIELSATDKGRYEGEKQVMIDNGTFNVVPDEDKRAKKKEKPVKGVMSAYMYFCKDKRPQYRVDKPNLPFKEFGKLLGEEWKKLNDSERAPYEEQSSQDRDRHAHEMRVFKERQAEEEDAKSALLCAANDADVDAYIEALRKKVFKKLLNPEISILEMKRLIGVVVNTGSFELMRALDAD